MSEEYKGVELVTMGVVTPEHEIVTKDQLLKAFPDKSKTITDDVVMMINMSQMDPQFDVLTMFNQMIEFKGVLDSNSKSSMVQYVNAIKFCSYLESTKDNYTQAYIKTFAYRDAVKSRMFLDTSSTGYRELTNMASNYSRSPLVTGIRTMTDAPLQLLVRGQRMKALNMLMTEAASGTNGRDRVAALDAFLKHTAPIAEKGNKLELNIGITGESQKMFTNMSNQLHDIANQQRQMLEAGMSITDVQKLNLKKEEYVEDDEEIEEGELC